ncbi:MAG: AI-2E family transporter [Hyphomicrobiaceae bacterium]|nr:AI-2E family transporter [Hyphomicrobiaceae bacterium]
MHSAPPSTRGWSAFVLFLVGGVVTALFLALWQAHQALLLAFLATVVAVMLTAAAELVERWLGLGRRASLALAGLVLIGLLVGSVAAVGTELARELAEIRHRLPEAVESLEKQLGVRLDALAREALDQRPAARSEGEPSSSGMPALPGILGSAHAALSGLASVGGLALNVVASILLVVSGGFFLAAAPGRYKRGLVLLFPDEQKEAAEAAIDHCGQALRKWLVGQLVAMAAVGLLTGLGAWWLGLPAPLAIGVLAGITEFVPILGPWLGAVPALILAASQDWGLLLWTGALFIAIQQLEGNLITPLAQQRAADVPPFLVLYGVLVLGLIFGPLGLIVSGPLTVATYVMVTELYVRDTLGHDVEVPGVKTRS